MKINIEIPDYDRRRGLRIGWEKGFLIRTRVMDETTMIIKANREGLISLAYHLLTLAQLEVPSGHHIHYDDIDSLEEGSNELIIERL